jgi:hypothetical protein
MPNAGEELTQPQVDSITNWKKYANSLDDIQIDKGWHQGPDTGGQFEGWATGEHSGYTDGYPLYAGVLINGKKLHVYWMPLKKEIKLAGIGENPLNT